MPSSLHVKVSPQGLSWQALESIFSPLAGLVNGVSPLKGIGDGCTKLQPVNCFSLLPILDRDIPHGGVKTFMTSQVFYGERPYSLLV